MKNTYIVIIVVILAVLGFVFFGKGNKLEAPATTGTDTSSAAVPNTATNNNPQDVSGMENELEPAPIIKAEVKVSAGSVKEFTVTGSNYSFAPNVMKVKKGDTVKITFKNANGMHDLKIDEFNASTKVIASGATETISFVADKTGSFEYYCSVGSHRANGMKGTLVVE